MCCVAKVHERTKARRRNALVVYSHTQLCTLHGHLCKPFVQVSNHRACVRRAGQEMSPGIASLQWPFSESKDLELVKQFVERCQTLGIQNELTKPKLGLCIKTFGIHLEFQRNRCQTVHRGSMHEHPFGRDAICQASPLSVSQIEGRYLYINK